MDYISNSGRSIWVSTSNPYIGSAHSHASDSISVIHGGGNNNVVKFIITNPLPKYNNNGPAYTHEDDNNGNQGPPYTHDDGVINTENSNGYIGIVTDAPQPVEKEDEANNEIIEFVAIDSQPVKAASSSNNIRQSFSTLVTTFSLLCLNIHTRFRF